MPSSVLAVKGPGMSLSKPAAAGPMKGEQAAAGWSALEQVPGVGGTRLLHFLLKVGAQLLPWSRAPVSAWKEAGGQE